GAIHTYLELYSRYCLDLVPRVALIVADCADEHGNLYTGPNTEDTPIVVEATQFKQGIVIAQVKEIAKKLPRVDIPGDWVDFVIPTGKPCYLDPLFTRDPAKINEKQILMAMLVLKGIYAEYGVTKLNHGIGYATAAIELILPTYGVELGLKGKVATHWALNPHPTMIPAIESGFVQNIFSFGSEVGMEKYIEKRPDVFAIGPDGSLRSNRMICQAIGHYAIDLFIGATLQIDQDGNSSTATKGRISGFGGAPNMGTNAGGRRHWTEAWGKTGEGYGMNSALDGEMPRGRKLVVQMLETRHAKGPNFVERLDAWDLAEAAGLPLPPVMIYGSDVSHIVSEEGIAYLYRARSLEERRAAIRAIAGDTPLGQKNDPAEKKALREAGIVKTPEDLGIDVSRANRDLLAAQNLEDLVRWSGGLYEVPAKFR
nr:malonate decarboxylase subunit alpha [Cyanobacteria bacterium UBA8530]